MSRRSLADTALLTRLLGTEVRSGFAISDPDLVPLQRKELIARSAVCALGFVLAASWGTLLAALGDSWASLGSPWGALGGSWAGP